MKNKFLLWITIISTIGIWLFLSWCKQTASTDSTQDEQLLLEKTITISKSYIALRYQTDHLLNEAETYTYDERNQKMTTTIQAWTSLENDAKELEKQATEFSKPALSFRLFPTASAYDRNEISNIFDKAPAGKKIATLAKHLWIDAKTAFKILKNDQAQVEADAWNEAGDTFQKLETSATLIKDGCKIAGFVGGIAVTWWAGAIAAGSTLGKAAIIVWGADLVLEVTDDGAKIALGNHNKISSIIWDVRTVTEPIANILTITDIPNNLKNGFEKFTATMVALESFRGAAQEGKIIGIELPKYEKTEEFANIKKHKAPIYISSLTEKDVDTWLQETQTTTVGNEEANDQTMIKELIKNIQEQIKAQDIEVQEPEKTEQTNNSSLLGVWEGVATRKESSTAKEDKTTRTFNFKENGIASTNVSELLENCTWTKQWNIVKVIISEEDGFYEFNLDGDEMKFIRFAWPDESWELVEILAWGDFFGGKFFGVTLKKVE